MSELEPVEPIDRVEKKVDDLRIQLLCLEELIQEIKDLLPEAHSG